MFKKSDILNIFSVGLKLFLITAIAAVILAVINSITKPVIEVNTYKKQNESMQKVLHTASSFEEADMSALALVDFPCAITGVYNGYDADGNVTGFAVMVSSGGYGGDVSLAVGIDNELKVTGIDVISHSETPGLGAKCVKDEFKGQFVGKGADIQVVKSGAKDNQIDAITSATITSRAVTNGVNTAISAVKFIKEAE